MAGFVVPGLIGAYSPGLSTTISTPPQWETPTAGLTDDPLFGSASRPGVAASFMRAFAGVLPPEPADTWFETLVVLPRRIDLGILLTVRDLVIDIYNAYRHASHDLSDTTITAGGGISFTDLPSLPHTILPQDGFQTTLEVLLDGPATIRGSIIFIFDDDALEIAVPITGQRAITFPFEPIVPLIERLRFATDVIIRRDGTEQRIALRFAPRQLLDMTLETEGDDRQLFDTVVFDSQHRPVGIPIWFEAQLLKLRAAIGDSSVRVARTDISDFRVGGNAIVWSGSRTFEVMEILSVGPTDIFFTGQLTANYRPQSTRIMPIRVGFMAQSLSGSKQKVNLQQTRLLFTILDSESDLSSVVGWPTFSGKVLLDDPNAIDSTLNETWERKITTVDNKIGQLRTFSDESRGRRTSAKSWATHDRAGLWKVRQLLHALKGRTISFYLPTFFDDLTPTQTVVETDTTITVRNIGYTKFVQSRQPRNVVRVLLNDGTAMIATVTSSVELSETEERLTIDPPWSTTATVDEIARIDLVEKCRFDSDDIVLRHLDGLGSCVITAPVITVNE